MFELQKMYYSLLYNLLESYKRIQKIQLTLFQKALKLQKKFGPENMFVLTARPQAAAPAIHKFLKGVGLNIPLQNITGLEDGTPQAKAQHIVKMAADGYNNFLFADDAIKNVKNPKGLKIA